MHQSSVADFVSRLNLARIGRFKSTFVWNTKLNMRLLIMFYEFGIILRFIVNVEDPTKVEVFLNYGYGFSPFRKLKLISKPSKKVFVDMLKLTKLKNRSNLDFYIISTSKGLLFDHECYKHKIGGMVLIKISV